MKESLHVLHIEDCEEDSQLVRNLLARDGLACEVKRVDKRSEVFEALQNESFDLILTDCKLPGFSGLHALEIARALKPDVPFVFVSGTIGEEAAIESLRNGATDYVLKDHLARLVPAVRRALAEAEEHRVCRQLQQRLREARRLEAVSTLSNGIAHDFNNILTIILGHASLLEVENNDPQRVLQITDTISHAVQRASDVVQQLLAFTHNSDGLLVPTEINERIREILDHLKTSLPATIEPVFEPAENLPDIMADASQLKRIVTNLMNNAADAMPTGGRATVSTGLVPATAVPDLMPEAGGDYYVCVKVADTGAGMDESTRQQIFDPFYTTKDRSRGSGLGLPVVYGLMQLHHGWIHVESELGKGTVVSLYFPVPPEDAMTKAPVSRLPDPQLKGSETILVVEDETDVDLFLETIFKSYGYNALIAHDDHEALELFQSHPDIQLVLSDIGLPGVDGITLCAKLKKLKPDVKVILASGYSSKEFDVRMKELGIEAFVPKPYSAQDILQCVRVILDRAGP